MCVCVCVDIQWRALYDGLELTQRFRHLESESVHVTGATTHVYPKYDEPATRVEQLIIWNIKMKEVPKDIATFTHITQQSRRHHWKNYQTSSVTTPALSNRLEQLLTLHTRMKAVQCVALCNSHSSFLTLLASRSRCSSSLQANSVEKPDEV